MRGCEIRGERWGNVGKGGERRRMIGEIPAVLEDRHGDINLIS